MNSVWNDEISLSSVEQKAQKKFNAFIDLRNVIFLPFGLAQIYMYKE